MCSCPLFGLHWLRRAAGRYSLLRLQMKPRERLPWGLGNTMQRYGLFRDYASFPATFFSWISNLNLPSPKQEHQQGDWPVGRWFWRGFSASCCSCCSCCSYFEAYNCNNAMVFLCQLWLCQYLTNRTMLTTAASRPASTDKTTLSAHSVKEAPCPKVTVRKVATELLRM